VREILETLATIIENPAACAAIGSVRIFIAVAGITIVILAAGQAFLTWRYRRRWPVAAPASRVARIYEKALRRRRVARPPRLRVGSTAAACTIGFWRSDVCVSDEIAEQLDDDELEAVLLHELAHARRRDVLGTSLLLFGTWVAATLLLFPMLGNDWHIGATRSRAWISATLASLVALRFLVVVPGRFLRELTCDDEVVRTTGNPLALAAALVKVSRARATRFTLLRIRRLVDYRPPRIRLAVQRLASASVLAALAFLCSLR
jgi:Zn-dependent protease with chaperone function